MLQRILIICLLVILGISSKSQVISIGDTIPDFVFENTFLNGDPASTPKNLPASQFKGKLLLIDFWATWCGPCIAALSKYEKLQTAHRKQLQVVTITQEDPARIRKFLLNRPIHLDMAIDTADRFQQFFPYRTIPHTILIDPKGVVRAITHSDEITDSVIDRLYNGKDIALTLKKDDTHFNYEEDYFKADTNLQSIFNLQPGIDGVGTFSKKGKGVFANRRISMHNFTIDGFYRIAYQVSFFRQAYEMDKKEFEYSNKKNLYCLDVIVPKGQEKTLYKQMQKQLPRFFEVKTRWEKRKTTVYILKRNESAPPLTLSKEVNDDYSGSSNFFTGNGVKLSSLADFLEGFGILGTPVLDETGLGGRFDIHMEWQPEKKGDMKEVFLKNGFVLEITEREIPILVIYK